MTETNELVPRSEELIEQALESLSELKALQSTINMEYENKRAQLLTPEIRQAQADLEAEFSPKMSKLSENISVLEAAIKQQVIDIGRSVKGRHLRAEFVRPRITWDSKMLEGVAAVIPQVAQARKVGAPSARIAATED